MRTQQRREVNAESNGNGERNGDGRRADTAREAHPRVSAKQLRANRRNAKRSTGPRTPDGKSRSSLNAITHGAFCKDLLLPGEDQAELLSLQRGIYASLSPQDEVERELVDRVAANQWRLRRARAAERIAIHGGDPDNPPRIPLGPADFVYAHARREWLEEVCRFHGHDPKDPTVAERIAETVKADTEPPRHTPPARLARALCSSGSVDRLSVYQQRLEQSVHRAMRELRLLRKDRGLDVTTLPPCPYLEEEDDAPEVELAGEEGSQRSPHLEISPDAPAAQNAQNEPISREPSTAPVAAEGCEQSSCDVVIVKPTRLTRSGAKTTPEDEGKVP